MWLYEVAIPTVVSFSSFFRLLHYSTLSHVAWGVRNKRITFTLKKSLQLCFLCLAGNRTEQAPLPCANDLFSADLEGEINMQINKELFIHYTFLSMVIYRSCNSTHFFKVQIMLTITIKIVFFFVLHNSRKWSKNISEKERGICFLKLIWTLGMII